MASMSFVGRIPLFGSLFLGQRINYHDFREEACILVSLTQGIPRCPLPCGSLQDPARRRNISALWQAVMRSLERQLHMSLSKRACLDRFASKMIRRAKLFTRTLGCCSTSAVRLGSPRIAVGGLRRNSGEVMLQFW